MVRKSVVDIREHAAKSSAPKLPGQRAGAKQAMLIAKLQAPEGAMMEMIVAAQDWQVPPERGVICGALKNKPCLIVPSEKIEGRGAVYRIYGPVT